MKSVLTGATHDAAASSVEVTCTHLEPVPPNPVKATALNFALPDAGDVHLKEADVVFALLLVLEINFAVVASNWVPVMANEPTSTWRRIAAAVEAVTVTVCSHDPLN